jgi:hypothetical protein
MAKRPDPQIPRAALPKGILTCLSVASARLSEADLLLSQGFITQAGVLFTLAVEEFGTASLWEKSLRDRPRRGGYPRLLRP